MKIKSSKGVPDKEAKLHKIKAAKNDIGKHKNEQKKSKKQKQTIESSTGSGMPLASSGKHILTFAEKKVLAVKKKNKKDKLQMKGNIKNVIPEAQTSKEKNIVTKLQGSKPNVHSEAPIAKKNKKQKIVQNEAKISLKEPQKNEKVRVDPTEDESSQEELPKVLVSSKTLKTAFKACRKALDEGFDQKKNLFGEDLKFGLQIASVKIPDVPSRNCRMQLPNAIYRKGDDICLIVKDLGRGRKQDTDQTLHYWQDKLREVGIDYIAQVIPFQQLKQDYREYEMKLKLVHRFDRFLVDARINGHVFNFLGNGFIRRCKNPTPVILDKDEKIVKSLNRALGKVTYKQTNTGRLTEIQFATHKMPLDQAVENGEALIQNLKSQFPGGWLNIRTIYLKPMTDIQLTFPLYVSKIDPNSVPVPKATGPRETFEKRKNEKLLKITKNKYKFEGGNLVRVQFAQRRVMGVGNDRNVVVEDREGEEEQEQEEAEDAEMANVVAQASDTEGSDPGDDD